MVRVAELLKINVYKAPGDKLQCIVQACKTIMSASGGVARGLPAPADAHRLSDGRDAGTRAGGRARTLGCADLITLNGAQAGADEFFPVLVYVTLQANPPSLLSTVQYIKYFYEPRASGEASYWWNQFVIAVQFIKTLKPAPSKAGVAPTTA